MKEWIGKLTAALILDLSDRAGIIDIEYDLDNDTRNELKETLAKIIKSHIDGELAQLRAEIELHESRYATLNENYEELYKQYEKECDKCVQLRAVVDAAKRYVSLFLSDEPRTIESQMEISNAWDNLCEIIEKSKEWK